MSRRLLWSAGWLLAALGTGLASGCVERTYTVLSNPPGAMVLENGHEVGPTPAIRPFNYFGKYRFTIFANGYQTLVVDEPICAPWYAYPPLDFITENLLPWYIRDHREYRYNLQPLEVVPPEVVLEAAAQLQARGRSIGSAPVTPGAPAGPPCPPPGQAAPAPGQPILPPGQPIPQAGAVQPVPPAALPQVVPLPPAR
jgi:hypothetical protein